MHITGYGICTWTFGDLPLAEIAARVAVLGFDGVELLGEIEKNTAVEVKRVLNDQGLRVFSLTPLDVDLAHPDDQTRQRALDFYFALLDFAASVGAPLISCHGAVGRIRPIATWQKEWALLVEGVRAIGARAQKLGLRVALELLNRYESHLLTSTEQGLRFLDQVGASNVGLHLDAYHMNIEEPNPANAIRAAGRRVFLFHVADSNREAVGRGHTDFGALIHALDEIAYTGPLVIECAAPGPDPFQAIKNESSVPWV
ncbi:MAG: sugar phosphate isomerase/epimerase, partial [Anaerolineales bacterium]|nr:sugar phosphate isomerase/epimerase [Anaerolineales bacterium]